MKKVTEQVLSFSFFSYFGEYLFEQKVVVVKPPEWTFVGVIARNAKFKGL